MLEDWRIRYVFNCIALAIFVLIDEIVDEWNVDIKVTERVCDHLLQHAIAYRRLLMVSRCSLSPYTITP